MLTPTAHGTYALLSETPIQSCWVRHGRILVIRAVTVSPKQQRHGFCFMLLSDNTGAKAMDTISLLRHLRRQLQAPMAVCWDRGRIYDRSREVATGCPGSPKIKTGRFPAYTPELNPDEYAWSHTKYAELCNHATPSLDALREEVDRELMELRRSWPLLKSFVEHSKLIRKQLY
jgi:transposase